MGTDGSESRSRFFDAGTSLLNLWVVRIVGGSIVFLASVSFILIRWQMELEFDTSYEGFNYAWTLFKVPLLILSTLMPIMALLAANHRSEQTKLQIKASMEQNIFTNHYKHVEEFEKYFNAQFAKVGECPEYSLGEPRVLHDFYYPRTREGIMDINPKCYYFLNEFHIRFFEFFTHFSSIGAGRIRKLLLEVNEHNQGASKCFGFNFPCDDCFIKGDFFDDSKLMDFKQLSAYLKILIHDFRDITQSIVRVLAFDSRNKVTAIVKGIAYSKDPPKYIFTGTSRSLSFSMYEAYGLKNEGGKLEFMTQAERDNVSRIRSSFIQTPE